MQKNTCMYRLDEFRHYTLISSLTSLGGYTIFDHMVISYELIFRLPLLADQVDIKYKGNVLTTGNFNRNK